MSQLRVPFCLNAALPLTFRPCRSSSTLCNEHRTVVKIPGVFVLTLHLARFHYWFLCFFRTNSAWWWVFTGDIYVAFVAFVEFYVSLISMTSQHSSRMRTDHLPSVRWVGGSHACPNPSQNSHTCPQQPLFPPNSHACPQPCTPPVNRKTDTLLKTLPSLIMVIIMAV